MELGSDKGTLRKELQRRRSLTSESTHRQRDQARENHLITALTGPGTVALYASRPGEPGTLSLISRFQDLGWRVLLPKLRREPDWAWATPTLVPAWAGIPEPTGNRLGAAALREANLIIVPCLAVGRDGSRLGTGGGWYDRALGYRDPKAQIWALANAEEVLPTVPTQPHDLPVDAVVTELGFTPLGDRHVS